MQKCQLSCSRSDSKSRPREDREIERRGYKLLAAECGVGVCVCVCVCVFLLHSVFHLTFHKDRRKGFEHLHTA